MLWKCKACATHITRSHSINIMQESMVRGVYQMLDNIEGQKEQVVDARGPGRFAGSEAEPRQGVRSGHMPGSVNMPFTQARIRAELGKQGARLHSSSLPGPICAGA